MMIHRFSNKIISFLDNISVRKKLILTYIIGFVLPLLMVGFATNQILIKQLKISEQQRGQAVLTVVKSQLSESFQSIYRLSGILYNDELIQTMLTDWKINQVGHLLRYRIQMRYYLDNFISAYPLVDNILLYTSNPAVIRGGAVLMLNEDVMTSPWAEQYFSQDKRTYSSVYIETTPIQSRRMFSMISNMGTIEEDEISIQTYLRLDLSMSILSDLLSNATPFGTTFLVDSQGRIVAESDDTNSAAAHFSYFDSTEHFDEPYFEYSVPLEEPAAFSQFHVAGRFPYQTGMAISRFFSLGIAGIAFLSILFASLVQFGIGYSLSRRLRLLTHSIQNSEKDHFPSVSIKPGADELGTTIGAYNRMVSTIDRLLKEVYEEGLMVNRLAVEKRHAELEALYSKINPHFLANSLNTIRMKSLKRNETETADVLKSLSHLFDFLTTWKDEMIPVEKEVVFIKNYLALQQYRFGESYQYTVETEPGVLHLLIPRMIVQPLVENASIHGIETRTKRGKITVLFSKKDNKLHITIADNGKGMDESFLKNQINKIKNHTMSGGSIGLQNVYNRLVLIYGNDADFRIESEIRTGTQVFLTIPCERRQEKDEKSDSC